MPEHQPDLDLDSPAEPQLPAGQFLAGETIYAVNDIRGRSGCVVFWAAESAKITTTIPDGPRLLIYAIVQGVDICPVKPGQESGREILIVWPCMITRQAELAHCRVSTRKRAERAADYGALVDRFERSFTNWINDGAHPEEDESRWIQL